MILRDGAFGANIETEVAMQSKVYLRHLGQFAWTFARMTFIPGIPVSRFPL